MDNYEALYYFLFNRITSVIEELKTIQQISEEMFITLTRTQEKNTETTV
ncbi:MAG: hypothetical protein IKJ05_01570 [Oscillospiraceae bacterium]|nr:hypothetical protein [Oscillospiraceae bacterium]